MPSSTCRPQPRHPDTNSAHLLWSGNSFEHPNPSDPWYVFFNLDARFFHSMITDHKIWRTTSKSNRAPLGISNFVELLGICLPTAQQFCKITNSYVNRASAPPLWCFISGWRFSQQVFQASLLLAVYMLKYWWLANVEHSGKDIAKSARILSGK